MAKYFIAVGFDIGDEYWDVGIPCKTKKASFDELEGRNIGVEKDTLRFIEIDLPERKETIVIEKAPVIKMCPTVKKGKK